MGPDPVVARGYGSCSDEYERARPVYPQPAVDEMRRQLRLGPGAIVLELGAGTGKLTRELCSLGIDVIALEPVAAMRARLAGAAPQARPLGASAEHVPCRDACVDAVIAATAFHWFDGERALAEAHRVLRPHGGLALVWNNPDRDHDWVDRVWGVVDRYRGEAPRNLDLRWQAPFERTSAFTDLAHRRFDHREELEADDVLARIRSISFIASLPPAERSNALAEVSEVLAKHPAVAGRSRVHLPYRTDLYWCWRR